MARVVDSKTVRSILSVQTRKMKFDRAQQQVAADELRKQLEDGSAPQYLKIAKDSGASDLYLLRRHVLPQTRHLVITQAALLIPAYILL